MDKNNKIENEYMKTIKNPLYKFLYGLVRFHSREILLMMVLFLLYAIFAELNLKEMIVGLFKWG